MTVSISTGWLCLTYDSDRMGGHYKNVITAQPKREDFHRPTNPSGLG